MAQLNGWPAKVLEHPMSPTAAGLLTLERAAAVLDQAENETTPERCHRAAEGLAAQLDELAPERLGEDLAREIRRWIEYLDGLAHRDGVDAQKVERLRSLLEQLERRLQEDWGDYFQRLTHDPWLAAYRPGSAEDPGFRPEPFAWAILGPEESGTRLARWREGLAPMRTAAETGLRLMRDALHRKRVDCPPQGYSLELPGEHASGLVRVEDFGKYIPELRPEGNGLRLRFRQPVELVPVTEPVPATLGWFTL
ncbi:cell division protein ZapD [Thiohalorhabdus sp.]|uniref:cell division protein ZapD n=1 Tax=Thiohalorhabdus sp. TaxID=3094134 RepID=UPI002FC3B995